jgi:hypothetical protein
MLAKLTKYPTFASSETTQSISQKSLLLIRDLKAGPPEYDDRF